MNLTAAIKEILTILGQLLGLVQAINGNTANAAVETAPYSIETAATGAESVVANPTYGNAAILAAMNAQFSTIGGLLDSLGAAVADIPTTGTPVTLPTTPPAGYGADTSGVAAAVWAYTLPGSGLVAGDQQDNAGNLAVNLGTGDVLMRATNASQFYVSGTWWRQQAVDFSHGPPNWDSSTILPSDTLTGWLDRESAYTGWTLDHDKHATLAFPDDTVDWYYTSVMDVDQFAQLKAFLFGGAATSGAPVWPGVDGVTIGTAVAISEAFSIVGPMAGVLVSLSTLPAKSGYYDFDGYRSYRNIGQLVFENDYGAVELPQSLGFTDAVYLPKTMLTAAVVRVRTVGGVAGYVTPFTIP